MYALIVYESMFGNTKQVAEEFDGFTIPAYLAGGWWPGTDRWAEGEFIRFTIDDALFR